MNCEVKFFNIRFADCLAITLAVVFAAYTVVSGTLDIAKAVQFLLWLMLLLLSEKVERIVFRGFTLALAVAAPLYVIYGIFGTHIYNRDYWFFTYFIILFTLASCGILAGSIHKAIFLNNVIYLFLYIANDAVGQFRKNFLFPVDILNIRTALSVSSSYMTTWRLSYGVAAAVMAIIIYGYFMRGYFRAKPKKKTGLYGRFIAILCALIFLVALKKFAPQDYVPGQFATQEKVEDLGYIAVFSLELINIAVEPPEGYSSQEAAQFLVDKTPQNAEGAPDIIVILNESFADFLSLGNLSFNEDYMPFLRGLMQTHQSGSIYVPTWSANTCNAEWELLTGNSMAFCAGGIPYTQYIKSRQFSIASCLQDMGYATTGIHPYFSTGYRRDRVYPLLGFDEFISIEDFDSRYIDMAFNARLSSIEIGDDPMYVRDLISDSASFQEIIRVYEEKRALGKQQFIFNPTMQNHAPYNYKDYSANIITNLSDEHPDKDYAEQYFSLLKETDLAVQELIAYFSEVKRDTIILFMGDHQPGIGPAFYNELFGHDWDYSEWSFEENLSRYQVPYVMWANFDYELEHDYSLLSNNFVSMMLMDAAELDKNAWYTFMHELYSRYPVITGAGVLDSSGVWAPFEEVMLRTDSIISQYENLQYYKMFGD